MFGTGAFGGWMMAEYAGAAGIQPDGTPVTTHITSGTALSSGTFNTANGDDLIWVPGAMRGVMSGLRHVPRALFRKLPI